MTKTFIVVEGNAIDGLSFTGPFASGEVATDYAEREVKAEWHIVELASPSGETETEDNPA